MKFLADMGISPITVSLLQSLGYDALHLHDEGLDQLPDSAILQNARDEQRILLSHDLDFGEMVAASEANMPSIVIFRLRNMSPKQVNYYLQAILSQHQSELARGAVISASEGQVRVRTLPIRLNE